MARTLEDFDWLTHDLAIGASFPCHRVEALALWHGIGAVVDMREEACDDRGLLVAHGMDFLHLPTPDLHAVSQPMLDAGVAFAAAVQAQGRRLLVHCEHGIGRSALLVLCILVSRGLEPAQALRLAKETRARVSPSPDQHVAWAEWCRRAGGREAPDFPAFATIAYGHASAWTD